MTIKYYEVTEIETITRTGIVIIDHYNQSCKYDHDPIAKFDDNRSISDEYNDQLHDCSVHESDFSAKEIPAPYDYNDRHYWPMTKADHAVWLSDGSGSKRKNQKNR